MRLLLIIILASLLSAAGGFAAWYAASAWLPNYDDAAGRGLGEVYRLFFTAAYVLIAMIAFGIVAPGDARERPVNITLAVLLLLPFLIDVAGCVQNGGSLDVPKEFFSSLQMFLPLWTVVVVQWLVVRCYIRANKGGWKSGVLSG